MSFVAVISVAALCTGLVWWERRVVCRLATVRLDARRRSKAWAFDESPSSSASAAPLRGAIETAIFAGDVALAHRDRLEPGISRGESPFQFRRSRIDVSVRRYERAVRRAHDAATHWLESPGADEASDRQRCAAVRHMVELLEPDARSSSEDMAPIEVAIDVLENTLSNLLQDPRGEGIAHPFR